MRVSHLRIINRSCIRVSPNEANLQVLYIMHDIKVSHQLDAQDPIVLTLLLVDCIKVRSSCSKPISIGNQVVHVSFFWKVDSYYFLIILFEVYLQIWKFSILILRQLCGMVPI